MFVPVAAMTLVLLSDNNKSCEIILLKIKKMHILNSAEE